MLSPPSFFPHSFSPSPTSESLEQAIPCSTLDLPQCENVLRARASRAKTCLFLPDVLIQCFSQSCMDDLGENLAGHGEQSEASPAASVTQITLFG